MNLKSVTTIFSLGYLRKIIRKCWEKQVHRTKYDFSKLSKNHKNSCKIVKFKNLVLRDVGLTTKFLQNSKVCKTRYKKTKNQEYKN